MLFKKTAPAPVPTPLPLLTLGTTRRGSHKGSLSLTPAETRIHMRVSGLSGYGKSSLLQSAFVQLLRQGACALIDPAGDLSDDILAYLLDSGFFDDSRGFSRLKYVQWRRTDYFVPYDLLSQPADSYTTAANVAEVFRRHWTNLDHGQAASFDNTMLFSVVALVENHKPLPALLPFISSKSYRETLLRNVTDPQIVAFFHDRFDSWGTALTESTARRVNLLLFNPVLRFSLGQAGSNPLDFHTLVREGTSVIHDLSGLDEDSQSLLGCLLTVNAEQAALSLAELPSSKRRPYYLFIDEWASFLTNSVEAFERGLALFRKYGVYLVMANQTNSQIPKALRGALGNVGVELAFRQSYEDSAFAAPRFTVYEPEQLARPRSPRGNASYASLSQQLQETQLLLQRLKKREALARVGDRVALMQTLEIPRPKATRQQIQDLKKHYAESLGTPAAEAKAAADALLANSTAEAAWCETGTQRASRKGFMPEEGGRGVFAEP